MRGSARSARAGAGSPAPAGAVQPAILDPARVSERAYSVYAQSRRTEAEPAAAAPAPAARRKPKATGRNAQPAAAPPAPAPTATPAIAPITITQHRTSPTEAQVRERAFQLYLARNGAPGSPEQDWLTAERQLSAEAAAPRTA